MHKVLIVDDDVDILTLVKVSLSMNNFIVEGISMWEQLDESIIKFGPHLILLDISLHGADGREICKKLRNDPLTQNIPVVLFSANPEMGKFYKECGAKAFIEKPYELSQLLKTIKEYL